MDISSTPSRTRSRRIGCVSFLNSKPLIHGLDRRPGVEVKFDVPSALLTDLASGEVDLALCPIVDYQKSPQPLEIVPAGGIACEGPTLTVRLFSQVPLNEVTQVHADTDSHTSVILMQVLLHEMYGRRPQVVDYHATAGVPSAPAADARPNHDTLLLIGDKVITSRPDPALYRHEIDLGEAWHQLTGLPFVFATWMCRPGAELGPLPAWLEESKRRNLAQVDALVERYAPGLGWPKDLARTYLGHWLRFDIGPRQIEAIERFWGLARKLGLIERERPLMVHGGVVAHRVER